MTKRKETLSVEETAALQREQFVREVQKRIQDKNHHDIADGIVWAIEQMVSGEAFKIEVEPEA